LEAALKPLAEKLGVAIDLGRCTFQISNCRFQLKIAVRDCDGKAITEETESFKRSAKLFGFESADRQGIYLPGTALYYLRFEGQEP
jgi:hypothetical protein